MYGYALRPPPRPWCRVPRSADRISSLTGVGAFLTPCVSRTNRLSPPGRGSLDARHGPSRVGGPDRSHRLDRQAASYAITMTMYGVLLLGHTTSVHPRTHGPNYLAFVPLRGYLSRRGPVQSRWIQYASHRAAGHYTLHAQSGTPARKSAHRPTREAPRRHFLVRAPSSSRLVTRARTHTPADTSPTRPSPANPRPRGGHIAQ